MRYEELEEAKPIPTEIMELIEETENLFDHPPKDRRKKREVQKWASDLNTYIKLVNDKAGFKMYKPIKL